MKFCLGACPRIKKIVNSPFGQVLQAIREKDFRAEAIGCRTVVYRTLSNVLSALFATLAGCLLALWLGILFVLSAHHFPAGVVGRLRAIGKPR